MGLGHGVKWVETPTWVASIVWDMTIQGRERIPTTWLASLENSIQAGVGHSFLEHSL